MQIKSRASQNTDSRKKIISFDPDLFPKYRSYLKLKIGILMQTKCYKLQYISIVFFQWFIMNFIRQYYALLCRSRNWHNGALLSFKPTCLIISWLSHGDQIWSFVILPWLQTKFSTSHMTFSLRAAREQTQYSNDPLIGQYFRLLIPELKIQYSKGSACLRKRHLWRSSGPTLLP